MADSIIYGAGIIALTALCAALSQMIAITILAGINSRIFIQRLRKASGRNDIFTDRKTNKRLTGLRARWVYFRVWIKFIFDPPDCIYVEKKESRVAVYYPGREDDAEEYWPG